MQAPEIIDIGHVGDQGVDALAELRDRLGHLVQAGIRVAEDIQYCHMSN